MKQTRYKILDNLKFNEFNLHLIDTKNGNNYLEIDIKKIPKGMSFDKFVVYLQDEKIIEKE